MKRRVILLWLFLLIAHGAGIGPSSGYAADGIEVFVSILPQQYFVEHIGGDRVNVSVIAPPGTDPHIYEPKPGQMVKMSVARIYFAVGVPFESVWLEKFALANPKMEIVHTETGIQKMPMASHDHDGEHASEEGRRHGMEDPHVWTSPPLVKIMAKNIRDALSDVDPAGKPVYDANYNAFAITIDELDMRLRNLLADIKAPKAFMVFHPSWGYFAKTYGLEEIPVEVAGKDPKPAQLGKLIDRAKAQSIKVIFVQPQFSAKSARTLANAIGGRVIYADPLAYDWAENLLRQAQQFREAME